MGKLTPEDRAGEVISVLIADGYQCLDVDAAWQEMALKEIAAAIRKATTDLEAQFAAYQHDAAEFARVVAALDIGDTDEDAATVIEQLFAQRDEANGLRAENERLKEELGRLHDDLSIYFGYNRGTGESVLKRLLDLAALDAARPTGDNGEK